MELRGPAQKSGMDGECEWNKLNNFHATVNIGEDLMHDWYEEICRYDVAIALHNLIYEQKNIRLEDLNSRLRSFYYGPKDSTNKPPEILDHQVKNKHIIMTSAEMHNLVTRLPMLIGLIVPEDDEILQFLIQLKRIIDIISSKVVQPETPEQLKLHISEYLEMRRGLFENEKEKPKHHLGLHVSKKLKNCYAVERVHGFKVVNENDYSWSSLTLSDIRRASVTYFTTLSDGGIYIYQNWIE
ncbi:hypothetical protein QAD02_001064 [Eretmocerus hayati]|uniref:Uncharacterized protein n=1 Tax=Eretmocerus hayati TaxID=131215 RepID=A0ACC2NF34_9HYME|nr:hypothetical protein QAD02_001064 [Eretmocerus hayati]